MKNSNVLKVRGLHNSDINQKRGSKSAFDVLKDASLEYCDFAIKNFGDCPLSTFAIGFYRSHSHFIKKVHVVSNYAEFSELKHCAIMEHRSFCFLKLIDGYSCEFSVVNFE